MEYETLDEDLKKFYNLIEEEWEFKLKENPVFASRTGDHRYDNRLSPSSEKDFDRKLKTMKTFKDQIDKIQKQKLSGNDQLNYEIFDVILQKEIQHLEFKSYRMPLSKVNGFHLQLPELYQFVSFHNAKDYITYIERLDAIPKFIDENIEIMLMGLKNGQIPPRVTMEGIVKAFKDHTNSIDQNQFFSPFKNLPETILNPERNNLLTRAQKTIETRVIPAYNKKIEFLESDYIPTTRTDISAKNLPNGSVYYQHCIWYYTSLNLTAKEIHDKGNAEVERIKKEMDLILNQLTFKGSLKDFINSIRSDPRFYVTKPEELLEKYALVCKRMDGQLPILFKTLPRLPYGILPIPDYQAPGNYTAYYQEGSGDGSKSGTYYVNTYDLKSRPLYEIEALSLHESVPGHHLQLALQQELDLPNFRRFSDFTSFIEGWALYAERLGLETGFYTDLYSNFGRLSFEMWRACRLVVDTGMHAFEWTRQQAIDFMSENTSLSLLNITNEVDRYISWPGQALAYKLGELKIRELREKAETVLGKKFDIRDFHDEILKNGSIPLSLLENLITKYLENEK